MLLVLTAALAAAAEPPRIIVEGWGSVKTEPNLALLSYDVHGEGSTNDQAVADLVKKSAAVEKALRSVDPAIDVHSDGVRVQAVRGKDCEEDRYEESVRLSSGECAIKGYVAVQDFSLRTARVKDAGTLVGLAGRHGAYNPKVGSFDLADDKDAKRRAIANAMAEARAKAEAVAAGSSAQLGPILAVSLDNARDSDELIVVSSMAYAPRAAERDEPIAVNVNPTPVRTGARVSVTYSITR